MKLDHNRWSAVSRHIIISIIAEMLIVTFTVFWWFDRNVWISLLWGVTLIVLFRVVIALWSFGLAWWYRSPHDECYSLTGWQWLQMVLVEIKAFIKLFFVFHALEPLLNKHDAEVTESGHDTILLFVHGFFSNAGFWVPFKRYLHARDLKALYTINLDPEFLSIDAFADQLAARVQKIRAVHRQQKLVLIGHSMGGLVCRAYIDRYGDDAVQKVITLGSPHHGTVLAYLLYGPNLTQMRPGSAWLNHLNAKPANVPISTHYSVHDNIVAPQASARLEGAKTYVLAGVGHLSMAFSHPLMAGVLEDIRSND